MNLMAYSEKILRSGFEVEQAILAADETEAALAHGAGLITDPDFFVQLADTPDHTPEERFIAGVSVVSVDPKGTSSFRTVTFGDTDPAYTAGVDATGSRQITEHGAAAGSRWRMRFASGVARDNYAEEMPASERTIGGVVVYVLEERNLVIARPFISGVLNRIIETHLQKLSAAERGANDLAKKTSVYMSFVRGASKRGGPVVVEQDFIATV